MYARKSNDVLIVGAGPTGMVLAIELARRGISFRLIDKRKGPTLIPRAFTLHAKTMEMFEHIGIAHHFLDVGIKSKGFNYNFKGKDAHPQIDFTALDSAYPYVLIYDQSWTDKHLREHLETTYDIRPEWSTELTELSQQGESCRAVLRREGSSDEEVIEPTWVIGCDGVRSFVREAADLDGTGSNYDGMAMELMDTKLHGFDGDDDRVHYYISKENFLLITKLPDGNHRLGVSGKTVKEGEVSNKTQHERFQTLVDEHFDDVEVAVPDLERKWEVWRRIAKKYRNGNIFLAGDAAHVHSPSGGQGMNVGMQDAYNLGWKLALVIQGRAKQSLLDTYESERVPVGEQVLAGTDAMHDIIMAHGQGMEDRLKLTQAEDWNEKTVARISGLSYNYRDVISLPPELKLEGGVATGDRAPNVLLEEGVKLFDILRRPRMTLLIAPGKNSSDDSATKNITTEISERFGELVHIHLTDGNDAFASRYGSYSQPHVYLIRPDGYVFCHCLLENAKSLQLFLEEWFNPVQLPIKQGSESSQERLVDLAD